MRSFESISVTETRGRKRIYDFSDFEIGETRTFEGKSRATIKFAANYYAKGHGLDWKFAAFTKDGIVHLVRVK